jgi:signal transduction histidine kinase
MQSYEIDPRPRATFSPSPPDIMSRSCGRAGTPSEEHSGMTRDLVIATVAHDLRNPLSVVYAVLDFVLENLLPEEDVHRPVRRQLAIARQAADQMLDLVTDLLDGATMDAGQVALRVQSCDPGELVHRAVDELEPLAAQRGITLSRDLAAALPAIHADRSRIARVFSNLGANAIRFTPPGGSITFTAILAADAVCFQVTDTGSGIAPQNLPYVFDRFWRANPAASDGAGLGLAIAKWIVEAHLGKIWVESDPGSGSTVSFTVPVAHRGLHLTPLHGSDM